MSNKILVTDSLFIFDEHVKQIENAGFVVERLDKPQATEEELCEAIKGKVGYILGGIEQVTNNVIDAADMLKAIVFTGTGGKGYIPAWDYATKHGIAIANAPYANAHAVAEWLVVSAAAMVRNLFALGRTGEKTFLTTHSLKELSIGIVGLGHIGQESANMLKGLGVARISYWSRSQKSDKYSYQDLEKLFSDNDVVLVCVADEAGEGFIGDKQLSLMKKGALVASITHPGVIDDTSLLAHLQTGHIRAILDYTPKLEGFKELPLDSFYCSNESTAYNAREALQATSDMATTTMINLLTNGVDQYKAN